jgi:hypothetical protein
MKANVVQHETYDRNRLKVSNETDSQRHRIDKRFEVLKASKLTNRLDFHSLHKQTEENITSLETTMVMHYDAIQEQMTAIIPEQSNSQYIQELDDKQEEVTQALDGMYTAIKEDLLTETKETLVAELDFEFHHNSSIKNRIDKITKAIFADSHLETAMADAIEAQLAEMKAQAKTTMKQHLAKILDPKDRPRNPYNPLDRALSNISQEIMAMVQTAVQEVEATVKGTVDQAIEDIRLSTSPHPAADSNPRLHPAADSHTQPTSHALPSVTPERTFRGRTVRIDEPPPRQDQYPQCMDDPPPSFNARHQDYDRSRHRGTYDEYDRSRDEHRRQRDQENFLKGHVEASLESLKEDDDRLVQVL